MVLIIKKVDKHYLKQPCSDAGEIGREKIEYRTVRARKRYV